MDTLQLGAYTIYVQQPERGLRAAHNGAVLLNDGELLPQLGLRAKEAVLFGIVPQDRLTQYTPWPQKALRPDAPDFGGGLREYHRQLLTEILPALERAYALDPDCLAYGGFSLGGLAAIMSLWETTRFRRVFSVCGSFWYPGVVAFMEQHPPCNRRAEVFLLNGAKEGEGHDNCLREAPACAERVHGLLSAQLPVCSIMDGYAHHQRRIQRFDRVLQWLEQGADPQYH